MSYADRWTDKQLADLEKKIYSLYAEAQKDFEKQADAYFKDFAERDEKQRAKVESGELSKNEYTQWRIAQMGRGERLNHMSRQMAERATKANEVAVAYVNDKTPGIYSLNRNHEAYVIEGLGHEMVGADFSLYNEQAVRRLVVEDPEIMPYYPEKRAVARGIDLDYGQKYIKRHVVGGIVQGKSVYKIADDLQRDVANMNRASAIRTARTAITAAQNGGRQATMDSAKAMGIKLRKRWVSAKDGRVRDVHGQADGQTVPTDEPFIVGGEKLMFPGDRTSASAWNLYNCRCGMRTVEKEGIEAEKRQVRVYNPETGKNELVEDMTYEEWAKLRGIKQKKTASNSAEKQSKKLDTVESVAKSSTDKLAGAYEHHRISNNLRSVAYDELPDNFVYAEYKNLSIESAREFDDTIGKLVDEYDTPLMKIRTMSKEEAMFNNSFASVTHNYTTDTAEMLINPVKCKDYEKMTERIKELSDKGYCVKIADESAGQYIATHEFAHGVLNVQQPLSNKTNFVNADYTKIKKARKEINEVYDDYIKNVGKAKSELDKYETEALLTGDETAWKKAQEASKAYNNAKISNYSLTNADEFLAESFANEKIGINSNEYSRRAVAVLDKYFKR